MSAADHAPLRSLPAGVYRKSSQYSLLQRDSGGRFATVDAIGSQLPPFLAPGIYKCRRCIDFGRMDDVDRMRYNVS
ncbi:hypothetical protein Taro_028445 [Colocasia esculenta]|uniref:Uncharacterized protein n=1 Tax=Colocasia esculenta TaxID=4460 RepID=A0A843VN62_COLES|nr:hypothetical protein [Colocasia esculenta]